MKSHVETAGVRAKRWDGRLFKHKKRQAGLHCVSDPGGGGAVRNSQLLTWMKSIKRVKMRSIKNSESCCSTLEELSLNTSTASNVNTPERALCTAQSSEAVLRADSVDSLATPAAPHRSY